MELLNNLLLKARKNDLTFHYSGLTGMVEVYEIFYDKNHKPEIVNISIGDLSYHGPATRQETLERMHKEIDEYLTANEPPAAESEPDRSKLTDQERAMREAGHKLSDFI